MNNVALFGGVDYHQDQLQVCVMDQLGAVRINTAVANDLQAVVELLPEGVQAIALEACCGSAAFGEALAAKGSWRVDLAHAGYVHRLKQSPDKTDFSDARLLADLTRVGYLPKVWLAPPEIRDLRQLVGHRVRLVQRRRATKLQIGALLRECRVKLKDSGSRWSQRWLWALKDQEQFSGAVQWVMNDLLEELEHVSGKIQQVEQRLRQATAGNELVAKLQTIEAVGEVTSWMLAAWVGRFDRFKNGKQLSRYCGLSPRNASTGKKQADAGLIDAANKPLRAVLLQAGHRLMAHHPRWGKLGESMLRRGKAKALVVAAVTNRWVRSLHHRMLLLPDAHAGAGPGGENGNRGDLKRETFNTGALS